jgi:hypothetical protein
MRFRSVSATRSSTDDRAMDGTDLSASVMSV